LSSKCTHVNRFIILDNAIGMCYIVSMYIENIPNRNSPPAILVRECYRENGAIKKRTLANVTKWPQNIVDGLRLLLKGEKL